MEGMVMARVGFCGFAVSLPRLILHILPIPTLDLHHMKRLSRPAPLTAKLQPRRLHRNMGWLNSE